MFCDTSHIYEGILLYQTEDSKYYFHCLCCHCSSECPSRKYIYFCVSPDEIRCHSTSAKSRIHGTLLHCYRGLQPALPSNSNYLSTALNLHFDECCAWWTARRLPAECIHCFHFLLERAQPRILSSLHQLWRKMVIYKRKHKENILCCVHLVINTAGIRLRMQYQQSKDEVLTSRASWIIKEYMCLRLCLELDVKIYDVLSVLHNVGGSSHLVPFIDFWLVTVWEYYSPFKVHVVYFSGTLGCNVWSPSAHGTASSEAALRSYCSWKLKCWSFSKHFSI